MLKQVINRILGRSQKDALLTLRHRIQLFLGRNDLIKLASLQFTNKWGSHWYMKHYQRFFSPLQLERLRILEIGIGGESDPREGGRSLRVWKSFFRNSQIYGIDIHDKKPLEESRITTFRGSQADAVFLKSVAKQVGGFDIIIDDGSHVNDHVIISFETLFPFLSENGLYVVEDTQHSYWPGFGGSSESFEDPRTMMGYFKRLADAINFEEIFKPGYTPSYYDRHVVAIHFFHNMIFVQKGLNDEGSNVLTDNATDRPDIME